ncbi:MAG: hypothetical protein WCJ64_25460, partial [Rhodospirillaceae bacterium]
MSSAHSDTLVNLLFDRACALADGNGVTVADLSFINGSRTDREIKVTQTIGISWDRKTETFAGRRSPGESRSYSSLAAMNNAVEAKVAEAAQQLSVAEEVKTRIIAASASSFPAADVPRSGVRVRRNLRRS